MRVVGSAAQHRMFSERAKPIIHSHDRVRIRLIVGSGPIKIARPRDVSLNVADEQATRRLRVE